MNHSDHHISPLGIHSCGNLCRHVQVIPYRNKTGNKTKSVRLRLQGMSERACHCYHLQSLRTMSMDDHGCFDWILMWPINLQEQICSDQNGTEKSCMTLMLSHFFSETNYKKTFKKYTSHLFALKPRVHTEFSFFTDVFGHNQVTGFLLNISDG